MSAESGKVKRQLIEHDEAVPLSDLMQPASDLEPNYEVIESEKPKRKRKPKPRPQLQIPYQSLVIGVAALLLGFVIATLIAFVPASRSELVVVPQPIEQSNPVQANPLPASADSLVDRWLLFNGQSMQVPMGTYVRVLSADNTAGFYNVADLEGHLTIASAADLVQGENAPSPDTYPPLGPYSQALGSNQKLLVTVEWNGDMPPGTLVYAMGWRAEDGTWIYEVSPDRVKIYYLPDIHLTWASSSQ